MLSVTMCVISLFLTFCCIVWSDLISAVCLTVLELDNLCFWWMVHWQMSWRYMVLRLWRRTTTAVLIDGGLQKPFILVLLNAIITWHGRYFFLYQFCPWEITLLLLLYMSFLLIIQTSIRIMNSFLLSCGRKKLTLPYQKYFSP